MEQQTNLCSGVRAEPRFLRDPTSFESLSSGLSRLSSYVASNLPKRKASLPFSDASQTSYLCQQQQQQQPPSPPTQLPKQDKIDDDDGSEKPTFATFQSIESANKDAGARLCLLLGYQDGFQVWDVSNPDNIHEICSVRDQEQCGNVSYLHVLANMRNGEHEPLMAVVITHEVDEAENSSHDRRNSGSSIRSNLAATAQTSTLRIYSLVKHEFVKEFPSFSIDEEPTRITCIKSNSIAIVLGCMSCNKSALNIVARGDFTQLSPTITDVYHDTATGPVFALGSRYLAYATNSPVVNEDLVMGQTKGIGSTSLGVLQGDKDVKGAAKDIAKEVVSGVKILGEYGYQRLSNYFNSNPLMMETTKISPGSMALPGGATPPGAGSPATIRSSDDRVTSPNIHWSNPSASSSSSKKTPPAGMIMIRDIAKLSNASQRNLSSSAEAHFRPHTHPLSCLAFNAAGTLLLSASKQGHTFHIFAIMPSLHSPSNISHLYSLSRGYTDALVEDCQFSADSMWCAVTTARGTTHVYAINPYGGKPDIISHVTGRINNSLIRPWATYRKVYQSTSLGSVVRIKQRRPVQMDALEDPTAMTAYPVQSLYYQSPRGPQLHPSKGMHVKLATAFLHPSGTPYLIHANKTNRSQSLSSATSFGSLKQHASTSFNAMLSSLGSTMNSNDPVQTGRSQHTVWTSAKDKASDNRLFGFDEEESPSALDDDYKLHSEDTVGYQDMYSIHPQGILTLHRCWITKSTVRKREHTRVVEKIDLNVKQEDVAEWPVARKTDWEQVKVAFPEFTETRRRRPWLSFAEINTYPSYEVPLWAYPQFSFQTFTQQGKELEEALWSQDEMPSTETVIVRRDMPEPYSSRVDRVNKTMTRTANQGEENLDDACAELEDNISKAMQTMFPTPSPTGLSYGSSPAGYKRLSSSAGAHSLQQPFIPGGHVARSSPSTISFEDAHLINMGSGPSPEDLLLLDPRFNAGSFRPTPMHNSSLIQLDDDDEIVPSTHGEEEGVADQLFSPDGDNEVAHPSESMLAEPIPDKDL